MPVCPKPSTVAELLITCVRKCRNSKNVVIYNVFVTTFIDCMLITVMVPIAPNFLLKLQSGSTNVSHRDSICNGYNETNSTSAEPTPFTSVGGANKNFELVRQHGVQHYGVVDNNILNGFIFAVKPFAELLTNPIVGPLTNRVGYSIPLIVGYIITLLTTFLFAFATNYPMMLFTRAVQGVGSSWSNVSAMGMLTSRFPDDEERGRAFGFALGGFSLGILVGPIFGGVTYEFLGMKSSFLIIAGIILCHIAIQPVILEIKVQPEEKKGRSLIELSRDPYILVAAGVLVVNFIGISSLDSALPIWVFEKMNASAWQQGIIYLPESIVALVAVNVFGTLAFRIGRWLSVIIGLVIIGLSFIAIPFTTKFVYLLIPSGIWGLGIGIINSAIFPLIGNLADLRHESVYGNVFAVSDVGLCLGLIIGSSINGVLVRAVGFEWMIRLMAILLFLYAPLMICLREPSTKTENEALIPNESVTGGGHNRRESSNKSEH